MSNPCFNCAAFRIFSVFAIVSKLELAALELSERAFYAAALLILAAAN
jgi:hypothetical protein